MRFTVHIRALKISHPLHTLATGPMKDSQLGYAKLLDVEPKTMQLFLEFVYTGIYRVEKEKTESPASEKTTPSTADSKYCTRCGDSAPTVCQRRPYCASAYCEEDYLSEAYFYCIECSNFSIDDDCAYCEDCRRKVHRENLAAQGARLQPSNHWFSFRKSSGPFTVKASHFNIDTTASEIELFLCHATLDDGSALEILDCRLTVVRSHVVAAVVFAKKEMADAAIRFLHLQRFGRNTIAAEFVSQTPEQGAFEQRRYDVGTIKHKDFWKDLKHRRPVVRIWGILLPHAKLWVFADRYLINDLKALCLHMLHRELLFFKINAGSAFQIFELLSYVYNPENTRQSDEDASEDGNEVYVNELRDLVISYAACIINELRDFKEYRETLRNGGDLAAELGSLRC
jgi:hypothetical protein